MWGVGVGLERTTEAWDLAVWPPARLQARIRPYPLISGCHIPVVAWVLSGVLWGSPGERAAPNRTTTRLTQP